MSKQKFTTIEAAETTVQRAPKNTFIVDDIADLPLNKAQLNKLLTQCLRFEPEEVAFMYLDFKENPRAVKAIFSINGQYLYCK